MEARRADARAPPEKMRAVQMRSRARLCYGPDVSHPPTACGTSAAERGRTGMRAAVGIFFALYLAAGAAVFRDYGVSWDEENSHQNGTHALAYAVAHLEGQP